MEIVFELQTKIPSVIHEKTSENQNVLQVAVKNRQLSVIEMLRKNLDKEILGSLIMELDNIENTVLHLAADTTNNERTWQIAGTAMQMMLDIKWYEYIRDLVQENLDFRLNSNKKSRWEVFEEKHVKKVKKCSESLKDLSNSCSVVAGLIAGAAFGTSSSVPGGTEKGKPTFKEEPAFHVFSIASLIGLCAQPRVQDRLVSCLCCYLLTRHFLCVAPDSTVR
uniref:PGG domain-containing protein n=2 Tax=Cajanus cajan TaxID=3821 RepID=A0A151T1G7_CAJCA|nr:hypothetical protein KK1_023314 [Cajanus cajan]